MARNLPTLNTYPGLELAGIDFGDTSGFQGSADLGGPIEDTVKGYLNTVFERELKPRIEAAAAEGAKKEVRPYIVAALGMGGVALVLSLMALWKRK